MKTLNATLLAALIAIPAVSFADGGATDFLGPQIHSEANANEVRAATVAARSTLANNDATGGLIEIADAQPKTRTQVLAELAEARRLGLVNGGEITIVPTVEQQLAISAAGERAIQNAPVAVNANVSAAIASPSVAQ